MNDIWVNQDFIEEQIIFFNFFKVALSFIFLNLNKLF